VIRIRLGFRAYDPHELLTHFVADRAGYYREAGLEVELVDLRAGEQPCDATCACGTALFQAMEGTPIEILLIASPGPLFWLYARRGADIEHGHASIATYPPAAAPARFLALALGPRARLLPARDDAARLALIHSGEADAVLLSSATPRRRVPEDLVLLFCLADRLKVPTTGIAAALDRDPAVERLVESHRRALALLADEPQIAGDAVREAFGFSGEESSWAVEHVVSRLTAGGRVPATYIDAALRAVGASRSPYAISAVEPGSHEEMRSRG
jgi:hypothetical protein